MGENVEVSRSTQFVSLDTHPANNALVVTYEILVSILDGPSQRELSRRNKRAQLQIHIKELDQLEATDLGAAKIDLGRISSQIIDKCPLLSSSPLKGGQHLEDIQLHLLYLINRRQASLLSRARPVSSSASNRSGGRQSARLSGRQQASVVRQPDDGEPDIYGFVRAREAKNLACTFEVAKFERSFEEHLDSIEAINADLIGQIGGNLAPVRGGANIDAYLEGLYGERAERFASLTVIRRLFTGDDAQTTACQLAEMSSNRLLISAMMRILRDSSVDQYCARHFILHCLIRITTYRDIYLETFEQLSSDTGTRSIDLVKILADLLAEYVKDRLAKAQPTSKERPPLADSPSKEGCNYLCAILVVLINLFKISKSDDDHRLRLEERIFAETGENYLGATLGELFRLQAKDLLGEIRLMGKPNKIIPAMSANLMLMRQLSCRREFLQRTRCNQSNQLLDSMVVLLNGLQLSRPGSGNPNANGQETTLVRDGQTLNELYELELNLLMLVNNLLMDSRIKSKLIKRKLLRPVLRNLVIFLATSSRSNNVSGNNNCLDGFGWSLVLMVPFRSLYELSCDKSVRLELYKSRIMMKCMLEYLMSCSQQELLAHSISGPPLNGLAHRNQLATSDWTDGAVLIGPTTVGHYILGVWINLSSLREAPIYNEDSNSLGEELQLKDLLGEYIDLALDKLGDHFLASLAQDGQQQQQQQQQQDNHSTTAMMLDRQSGNLMAYLHLKLLRNLSQFLQFVSGGKTNELQFYERCLIRVGKLSDILFDWLLSLRESPINNRAANNTNWLNMKPHLCECLASLSNLVAARPTLEYENNNSLPQHLASVIGKLFQLKCQNFATNEEDDDLLLISVQLIGFSANKLEICQASLVCNDDDDGDRGICVKILRACNFVLDSKLADHEMIVHTLYSLGQLMNHSQFLRALLLTNDVLEGNSDSEPSATARGPTMQDDEDDGDDLEGQESNLSLLAELLVDKLANLVLNNPAAGGGQQRQLARSPASQGAASRLALELLDLIRQLEQQTSIQAGFVQKIRFANYNTKWLAAIQASREALESPAASTCVAAARGERSVGGRAVSSAASWFAPDSELLFAGHQLDDDDDDDRDSDSLLGGASQQLRLHPMPEEREDEDDGQAQPQAQDESAGEGAHGDGQQEELDSSGSFGEAPDLNVIDPNSMIKHLSSRHQLRRAAARL